MKRILKKLGLIVNLEYSFSLSIDEIKERLIDESLDKKLLMIDNLIGSNRPIKSTDIQINDNSFHIEKKAVLNPLSGRGKIQGKLDKTQNGDTSVQCVISSNYKDFWFIFFAAIFSIILWIPFIVFGDYGYEWVAYLIGFFALVTAGVIYLQRYEVRKLCRDIELYFNRLNNKSSDNV